MKDKNQISETPERWIILRIPTEDNIDVPYYKVFAEWRGGYLGGDRWKINSGISEVEEDKYYYYFYGYSGSCYKCHKNSYGLRSLYVSGILANIIEKANLSNISIDVMPEETDWEDLIE